MAASTLVGVARVAGGSHFPTDVAAGFAVGAGVGIAVPALHGSRLAVAPMAAGADARGVALAGTF
jgi:membrane-associated phospholipid phosphatase